MTQTDVFRPQQWRDLGPLGPVGARTATDPHKFLDESNVLHFGKRQTSGHPFIVANEIVAARLAQLMGVEAPDVFPTRYRGQTWVMATNVPGMTHHVIDPVAVAASPVSKADIAKILCLDLLAVNRDRHWGNLIYMAGQRLAAIDHDRALFGWPGRDLTLVAEHGRGGACTTHSVATTSFVSAFGLSANDLEAGITAIEALTSDDIDQATTSLAPHVLDTSKLTELRTVVSERVSQIRSLAGEFSNRADLAFVPASAT